MGQCGGIHGHRSHHRPQRSPAAQPAIDSQDASAHDQAGISNLGYWGFPVRPQTTYHGSFYAKASDASIGPVTVSLVEDETGKAISTTVPSLTSAWQQHEFTLKSNAATKSSQYHLVLSVGKTGNRVVQPGVAFSPHLP